MTAEQYDNKIFNQAIKMGISPDLAKIMVAQARYESADYTNNATRQNNNLFGYKYVGGKWQAGPGIPSSEYAVDGSRYANYNSITDSMAEIVDWLRRRQAEGYFNLADIKTPGQYADALRKADYYQESSSNYARGLIAKYGLVNVAAVAGGSMLMILAILFFIIKSNK